MGRTPKDQLDMQGMTILVTGAAGFIGANLVQELFRRFQGINVIGVDSLNDYYDVRLKHWRLAQIKAVAETREGSGWTFLQGSIADRSFLNQVFTSYPPDVVVNLAAQAGVRESISRPDAYVETNLVGFYNVLEACRHSYDGGANGVRHLVYASSSSVYGDGHEGPCSPEDRMDDPMSLYAVTKKSNELMAQAYAKLYGIPSTGLRLFTVYGPGGRPDMAYFSFAECMARGESIRLFNHGNCLRDFTYIDDIVSGVVRVMEKPPVRERGEDGQAVPPHGVYNVGNSHPVKLLDFVKVLQEELVRAGVLSQDYDFKAHQVLLPMQPGDVQTTYADVSALERDFGFRPETSLRAGLRAFAEWFAEFYG